MPTYEYMGPGIEYCLGILCSFVAILCVHMLQNTQLIIYILSLNSKSPEMCYHTRSRVSSKYRCKRMNQLIIFLLMFLHLRQKLQFTRSLVGRFKVGTTFDLTLEFQELN